MNAALLVGAGAMLARLIGVGRRCGLEPEAVLLHVLDGAPLPEAAVAVVRGTFSESEIRRLEEMMRATGSAELASCEITGAAELSPEFKRKGERAVYLYGTTALSNPAIGRQIGSTPQTVSWFLRQARDRGDPLVLQGDAARGRGEERPAETPAPAAAPEANQAGLEELTEVSLATPSAAARAGYGFTEGLKHERLAPGEVKFFDASGRPLTLAVERRAIAASSSLGSPAPLTKTERAMGLWATTDLDYRAIGAEIGAGPDSTYELIRKAKKKGDPRWAEGFARRDVRKSPQPGEANGGGEHEVAEHLEQNAIAEAAGEPAGEAGQGDDPVAYSNSAETANEAPMVVDGAGDDCSTELRSESSDIPPAGEYGETRRGQPAPDVSPEGASEVVGELEGIPPASEPAGPPAPPPAPPAEKGKVRRASGSAVRPARPGPVPETTEAAPQLPDDQVVAINAGWIVGPAGTIKGFPLVNAILQVLAGGELVPDDDVAARAGARSPAAAQAMLGQWRTDLEKVGVEIVHFGSSIRLRRAGAQ